MQEIYNYIVMGALSVLGAITFGMGCMAIQRWMRSWCLWQLPRSTIFVLAISAVCATLQAQKVMIGHVDASAEESGDGSEAHPFKTIQEAISAISIYTNRFTVSVKPGRYAGPIVLDGVSAAIEASTNAGERVISGEGGAVAVRAVNAPESQPCPSLGGFTIAEAELGAEGVELHDCRLEGLPVAAKGCKVSRSVFDACGIAAEGCEISECDVRGSTVAGVVDCNVLYSYLTNNFCRLGVTVDSDLSVCLVADNATDEGAVAVSNGVIRSTTIAGNDCPGVGGEAVLMNTVLSGNLDVCGDVRNFVGDGVCMTNCCTDLMPERGTDNIVCAFPIRPDNYRLRVGSPAIGAGSTNYLDGLVRDLAGKGCPKTDGRTDIGAFRFVFPSIETKDATHETPIPVPYEWIRENMRIIVSNQVVKTNPRWLYFTSGEPTSGWRVDVDDDGSSVTINRKFYVSYYELTDTLHGKAWTWASHPYYYEEVAKSSSGKKGSGGKMLTWWEEYLTGTNPADPTDVFRAYIEVCNDEPDVTWKPNRGSERYYFIMGKRDLNDCWRLIADPKTSGCHFFTVGVELP